MLAEDPLPDWASGRRVVAVGAQTNRPVDDVALVTDRGGWVSIQAKKGLQVDRRPAGGLSEALSQLVEIDRTGVPRIIEARYPDRDIDEIRPLDPERDLVLILSDDSAKATVNANLSPVVGRLRQLPPSVPLSEVVPGTKAQAAAFATLRDNLSRCWTTQHHYAMTDADFRRMTRVLSVRALRIEGDDFATVQIKLRDLAGNDSGAVSTLWNALVVQGHRLAEERSYLDRDGLVRVLDNQGIVLEPLARLRQDIGRLQALTRMNTGMLGGAVSISTPEGPVRLARSVAPALLGADGNLAVTGAPGAGKTVLLHHLAVEAAATHDLVVLRSDDLRSSKSGTRGELNLRHDLADVLAGWTGARPGLLLIDGIDQARGSDVPAWLPHLASDLSGTRWRIAATIRTFDLKHGDSWRKMFPGMPPDADASDPELKHVRHLLVGDLNPGELADLRAASPRMATLLGVLGETKVAGQG